LGDRGPVVGEVVGFVCLHMEPQLPEAELGAFLVKKAEGSGMSIEAASAARDWAWDQGLTSLVSYVDPANKRALGGVARLGGRLDPEAKVEGAPHKQVYRYAPPASDRG
jgi:RimJ/RimL family protein N-acetyltransferase